MSKFLVVGAGAIGTRVARTLSQQGHDVVVTSRSGRIVEGTTSVASDAGDVGALGPLARGASAIFNCANPAYHRWPSDWPPIAASLLAAAESSGATLVTLSNLYVYGRVDGPMTPDTPLGADYAKARVRAKMWNDALAAHQAGRVSACEVRASDFIGPGSQAVFGNRVIPRLLAGKSAQVLGRLDQPHSWSFVDDVAATLVVCAQRPETWGRVWHVPTNAPRTQRQVVDDLCEAAGLERGRVSAAPEWLLRVLGLFSPTIRELPHTLYQFTEPFVMDDTAARTQLGLDPTPWPEVLRAVIGEYRILD
jgi:nucleoside-diphosphate-sugar epimerase